MDLDFIHNVESVELVDPDSIPFNINRREYYLIDMEYANISDLFYDSPSELKNKIDRGCIVIKIIKKEGQKS